MTKYGNKNVIEMHGCLVCAKIYIILAVYTPNGSLVVCTVTSPGGHCVQDERHSLVACDIHLAEEIMAA
jgi:hypothetical protein